MRQEGPLAIEEGIGRIRSVLTRPKGVVRLVGLSGTGKTRLVQALFDERVGLQSLDPVLALYSDLAHQPEPSPRELLHHLVQSEQRAIVIVDNCPPETHRYLAAMCTVPASTLSLITTEHDVGDDDPEDTEVFRLEPASDDVMERLVERRAPQVSQVDRRRIAEFSGGNARIALALAHTVRRGESIGRLSDRDVFERLFHQRKPQEEGLLKAAEVCSLVYSFDGKEMAGETAELPLLAELAGFTVDQLYRHVAELRSRDLIQRRGKWRAVLPPALANRLARQALERIPPGITASAFLNKASERLLRSFSRRLGYLHDCEAAQEIVRSWILDSGPLSNLPRLTRLGVEMFRNIAPVAPDIVLKALEDTVNSEYGCDFLSTSNFERHTWASLLRSLAYDPNLFPRAALLLARMVIAEPQDNRSNSALAPFRNLFQIYLSGTHASMDQRLQVVETLIDIEDAQSQACGLDALDMLLKAESFTSSCGFDFGARPRDYGWYPRSRDDIVAWYRTAVAFAQRLALSESPLSVKARSILANNFRGLWANACMVDELAATVRSIGEQGFWIDGWIAVCDTIRRNVEGMSPDHAVRLRELEEAIRPRDILNSARAYVFSPRWSVLGGVSAAPEGVGRDRMEAFRRANDAAERLGREIANKSEVLDALLPDLLSKEAGRSRQFGRGLAAGTDRVLAMWRQLVDVLATVPESKRKIELLTGFISATGERDAESSAEMLDDAVADPILGPWLPILQTSVDIDERGSERLRAAIEIGLAQTWTYKYLIGRASEAIPTHILRCLVLRIAVLPKGYEVAAGILAMRIHLFGDSRAPLDNELIECGRELVRCCSFERSGQDFDYELGEIVKACFVGEDAQEDATLVCHRLRTCFLEYRARASNYPHFLKSLFNAQPQIALDTFLGDDPQHVRFFLQTGFDVEKSPIDGMSEESLFAWTRIDPNVRFPRLASATYPFTLNVGTAEPTLSPMALRILESAPDRLAVLTEFGLHLQPSGWTGSLANTLESQRTLLRTFFSDSDPRIVAWAKEQDAELSRLAEGERLRERHVDESFE